MKYNRIANTDLQVSNLIMGNMRLTELSVSAAEKLIRTAMEENINFLIMQIFMDPNLSANVRNILRKRFK